MGPGYGPRIFGWLITKICLLIATFDFAQGHESLDVARDRELVERPAEWQVMP